MSYRTYFTFSTGLASTVLVPKGTTKGIVEHIANTEAVLHLVTEKYLNNPPHWTSESLMFVGIDDKTACGAVEKHNRFVRGFYEALTSWTAASPLGETEELTPSKSATFWHGLQLLSVPPERWTDEYYRARMETCYEVMRGREAEGIIFDAPPLTERQAAAVVLLFSKFLDVGDLRLDVPRGCDYLASSVDGGYRWCEHCGAIGESDTCEHLQAEDRDDDDGDEGEEIFP